MSRLLIVSPHPDDAEIAVGGLISMQATAGHEVTIAVCAGEGDLTMVHSGETVAFQKRRDEQIAAARELGADPCFLELAPASKFDQVPQARFVTAFDALFGFFDTVILPLPSYNEDHRRVWEAGMAAFRPGKADHVTVLAYEQPFGNCHGEQLHGREFGRRYYRLTGSALEAKLRAIDCHRSQMRGRSHSIYGAAGAEAHARLRGLEIGHHYAEMVYVIREIGRV